MNIVGVPKRIYTIGEIYKLSIRCLLPKVFLRNLKQEVTLVDLIASRDNIVSIEKYKTITKDVNRQIDIIITRLGLMEGKNIVR